MGKFTVEYTETLSRLGETKAKCINFSKAKEIILSKASLFTSSHQLTIPALENKSKIITTQINKQEIEQLLINPPDEESHIDQAQKDLNTFCSTPMGVHLKELIEFLDQEINTLYLQSQSKERDLFSRLNNHLQLLNYNSTFNILQLSSQMKKLQQLLSNTKKLCIYININMKCLNRIMLHCDKRLSSFFNGESIAVKYLKTKFQSQSSDLTYILQYKFIDEIVAIAPMLLSRLNHFIAISSESNLPLSLNSNNPDNSMSFSTEQEQQLQSRYEELLTSFHQDKDTKRQVLAQVASYHSRIEDKLQWLNERSRYRLQFRNYSIGIRYGFRAITNSIYFSGVQLEDRNDGIHINCLMDEELIIRKFVSSNGLKEYVDHCTANISKSNHINIHLVYLHTFLYLFLYSLTYLTPLLLSTQIRPLVSIMQYQLLSVTYIHLGEILSNFFFGFLLKNNRNFPLALRLSCLLLMIGYGLILCYKLIDIPQSQMYFLFISRLLIGIGSGKLINRKYLITYSPRSLLRRTIDRYHVVSKAGLIVGFVFFALLSLIVLVLKGIILNLFWMFDLVALIVLLVYSMAFAILFSNPKTITFTILKDDKIILDSDQLSASHRKTISLKELTQIQNINQQLIENNQSNQYTETNSIPNTIAELIQNERKCCSYVNKAFLSLLSFLLFNSFLQYAVMLYLLIPLSVDIAKDEKNASVSLIALFTSVAIGYLLPVVFNFFQKRSFHIKHWSDRGCLLIVSLLQSFVPAFIFCNEHFNKNRNGLSLHWIKVLIDMLIIIYMQSVNSLTERKCNSLLIKIIPQSHNIGSFNASLLLSIITTIGRLLLLITFALQTMFTKDIPFNLLILCFFISPLLIALCFFKALKLTAIGRIIKKNLYH